MVKNSHYKKRFLAKKHGLSAVVTALLLVVLSMAAVGMVWFFVNNMVKEKMSNSMACYGNYDKVTINKEYTCYNKTSPTTYELRFAISIGEVAAEKIVVSVASASAVKSYTIRNISEAVSGLASYPSGSAQVVLPGKNSGLSYNAVGFGSRIDSIEIAPYIGGEFCDVSDSLFDIESCDLII